MVNCFQQKRRETASSTLTPTLLAIFVSFGAFTVAAFAADPSWWSHAPSGEQPAVVTEQITTTAGVVTTNFAPNPTGVVNQGQLKQFTVRAVDELNAALPGGAGTNLNSMASNWAQDYLTNGWSATSIKPSDYTAMNQGQLKTIANMVYGRISAAGYTNLAPSWLPQNTNSDNNVAVLGQLKEVFDFDFSLSGATALTTASDAPGTVNLYWTLPTTNYATSWLVEQQKDDGTWTIIADLANPYATTYSVTGLTNGQSYTFQVIGSGTNNYSVPASASATPIALPSGLAMWFKADGGVTQDGSGNVSSWADQTGNFTVSQTVGTARPAYITNDFNGYPGLRFSGSQSLGTTASLGSSLDADLTIITVGSTTDPSAIQYALYLGQNSVARQNRAFEYYSSSEYFDVQSASSPGTTAPIANTLVTEAVTLDATLTNLAFYRNSTLVATNTISGLQNVVSGVAIGAAPAATGIFWKGDITEQLVFSRKLSSTELAQVNGYLADKYGMYDPNATWPLAYTSSFQHEIARNKWNKSQSATYAAFQAANPSMPTGLLLWLRADAGVTTNASGVASIVDQAGNYTLAQTSSSYEPIYVNSDINGHPALRFTGSQSLATTSSIGDGINKDITLISVGMSTNTSPQQYALYLGKNQQPAQNRAYNFYGGYTYFDGYGNSAPGGPVPPANFWTTEAITLDSTLTNVAFYQNGVETTNTVSGLQNVVSGATMGAATDTTAYSWRGDIAEQLVYDHQLSSNELGWVEAYLAAKYNLSLTLPAPVISPSGGTFATSVTVSISSPNPAALAVRYTVDGTNPTSSSLLYTAALTVTRSCPVTAALFLNNVQISADTSAQFYVGDSGGIGISDAWQIEYFGHTGINPSALAPGGGGLTNLQAYLYGYNPNLYSSNGDGLSDLVNYQLGYSATDTDINGYTDANGNPVTNAEQLAMGLDPFDTGVNPTWPTAPTSNPSDHTAPVITLTTPAGATLLP